MKFRRQHQLACSLPGAVPIACVMFLLLFHLITNSAVLLTKGVPLVRLPEGGGARPEGFADSVVVAVNEQEQIIFRNQQVNIAALQGELKQLADPSGEAGLLLILKADRSVSNQRIMEIAHAAHAAGVRQIWLAARPQLFHWTPEGNE